MNDTYDLSAPGGRLLNDEPKRKKTQQGVTNFIWEPIESIEWTSVWNDSANNQHVFLPT